jgi:hypothetical protein
MSKIDAIEQPAFKLGVGPVCALKIPAAQIKVRQPGSAKVSTCEAAT